MTPMNFDRFTTYDPGSSNSIDMSQFGSTGFDGGWNWNDFWTGLFHPIKTIQGAYDFETLYPEAYKWANENNINYLASDIAAGLPQKDYLKYLDLVKSGNSSASVQDIDSKSSTGKDAAPEIVTSTNSAQAAQDWNSIVSSLMDSLSKIQQEERAYNEKQTLDAWNRTMQASNTAYQRAVADIKAAGLNPWLAVQGSQASSPTSAVASSNGSSPSTAINSATSLINTLAQVSLLSQSNQRDWIGTITNLIKVLA